MQSYTEVSLPLLERGYRKCGCGYESNGTRARAEHMRDCSRSTHKTRRKRERGAK